MNFFSYLLLAIFPSFWNLIHNNIARMGNSDSFYELSPGTKIFVMAGSACTVNGLRIFMHSERTCNFELLCLLTPAADSQTPRFPTGLCLPGAVFSRDETPVGGEIGYCCVRNQWSSGHLTPPHVRLKHYSKHFSVTPSSVQKCSVSRQ